MKRRGRVLLFPVSLKKLRENGIMIEPAYGAGFV